MAWIYHNKPPMGWPLDLSEPINDGLIGCWYMPESSGSIVNDLSGNNNTGVIAGSSWSGGGVKIDAATDRIVCAGPVLSQTEGTFICCLRRFAAWSTFGAVFNIENASNDSSHEMLLWSDDGDFRMHPNRDQDSGDYWEFGAPDTIFPLNTDIVLAATWKDGVAIRGYINGALFGSQNGDANWTTAAWADSEQLCIGNTYGTNFETNCIYKWAYAYNHVLSPSKIAQLSRFPFYGFMNPDEIPVLDQYYTVAAAGNAGIMTPNTGYWGPTF